MEMNWKIKELDIPEIKETQQLTPGKRHLCWHGFRNKDR
jgi:hypothetical protein